MLHKVSLALFNTTKSILIDIRNRAPLSIKNQQNRRINREILTIFRQHERLNCWASPLHGWR